MNADRYYQPPSDPMWDYYVDHCDAEGIEPDAADYEEWLEIKWDEEQERRAERAMEDRMDSYFYDVD